jgi:hypothetical protein
VGKVGRQVWTEGLGKRLTEKSASSFLDPSTPLLPASPPSHSIPAGGPLPYHARSAPVEDSAEVDPSELEGDYSWSKEYQYTLTRRDEAVERQEYIIRFRDGVAAYCEINGKMDLKKRKDGAQESMAARPAKVVVRRRELTEAEEAQRDNTMRRLLEGQVSDEEEEEVEDA